MEIGPNINFAILMFTLEIVVMFSAKATTMNTRSVRQNNVSKGTFA